MKPDVKLFNLPNLLTAGNMLSGILSILCVFMGRFEWAPWFIFLGAIFDFLDGFAARLTKQYSELGKQMDSLADMITFGVAPGIIMMVIIAISIEMGSYPEGANVSEYADYVLEKWKLGLFHDSSLQFEGIYKYLPFLGLMIPVFSLFRLAKFNIDTRQSESFIGMPTPAVTLFLTLFATCAAAAFATSFAMAPTTDLMPSTAAAFIASCARFERKESQVQTHNDHSPGVPVRLYPSRPIFATV